MVVLLRFPSAASSCAQLRGMTLARRMHQPVASAFSSWPFSSPSFRSLSFSSCTYLCDPRPSFVPRLTPRPQLQVIPVLAASPHHFHTMAHMQYMHRGGVPLHSSGSIHVVCGPMFSGKTTELLRRMKRFSLAKRRCMLIKYANDNRYSLDGVVTHDMQQSAAVACSRLAEVADKAADFEVLGIDEGQFFPDVVEFSERMANEGKTVIVAALDGTFQRKAFGPILDLIPLAESVIKLSAVCMLCHREAAFSKRIGSETEIEVIGGADKYIAVCRECYHSDGKKRNGKKKQQQQQQQQSGDTTCVQGTKSEDMHARVNDSLESTTTESEGGDADDEHTHDDGSESDSASSDGFSGTASPTDATPSKKKEFHPRSTRSLFTATRN